MERKLLVMMLAAVFAGLAVIVALAAITHEPFVIILALLFGVVAYLMWYQASGRLTRRLYRTVENRARHNDGQTQTERGSFGANPRETQHRRTRNAGFGSSQQQESTTHRGHDRTRRNGGDIVGQPGLTSAQAYEILGVDPGVGEAAIKEAYREKVKDVHPDTENGSEEAFKRVKEAYEQLTD